MNTPEKIVEEPQAGGSYQRNADGTLTLIERTGRTPAAPAVAPAPPSESAPADSAGQ